MFEENVFSNVMITLNVVYWLFLAGYLMFRFVRMMDDLRYLAACERFDMAASFADSAITEDGAASSSGEPIVDASLELPRYQATPAFPFLMAAVVLLAGLLLSLLVDGRSIAAALTSLLLFNGR